MWDHLKVFFDTTMFSPHGICLLWEPELLIVHVVSDAIIALSYFSIPFALAYFVFKRRTLSSDGSFGLSLSSSWRAVLPTFSRSIRFGFQRTAWRVSSRR